MIAKYALIGGLQVKHSLSPIIYHGFAKQTQQTLSYQIWPLDLNKNDVLSEFKKFVQAGFQGINVTMPFKQAVFQILQQQGSILTERAVLAAAVNTVKFQSSEQWLGDNTDGAGFINDISQNLHWQLTGKRLLICGAGGAARGILKPLLDLRPSELVIANRSKEKALSLAQEFNNMGKINGSGFNELKTQQFDVIINAIAAGHVPDISPQIFAPSCVCYDLSYSTSGQLTDFLSWVKQKNLSQVMADGLGMLVEQAAQAYEFWFGIEPKTKPVISQLQEMRIRNAM